MRSVLCAALLACAGTSGAAQPVTLESADHDVVEMTLLPIASTGVAITSLGPRISGRLASVCLNVPGASAGPKGFDTVRDRPPATIVLPGESGCALLEPTAHVLYFFKERDGAMAPVLSYRLDLRDRDGLRVIFDWLRDRAD